ncbi:DUF6625 family protein [Methylomonas sp. MK1]|uniref:DUF6625 family protein n=1 Tax=Methylomonas sp. MK1 TaxID=1131552 RepID=UPI00036019D9|nr:DUF6625 family protein [Methylomonas sp. MK1]
MRVIILNLYFGKRPAYFDLFIHSCRLNNTIDFLFFVDFEVPAHLPDNVRFIKTDFEAIRTRFQSFFDFPIALNSPYKLTDFQPAYGELLSEYLNGYEWWGHCDFDMLFGDLSPVLKVVKNDQHVKIFRRGHLTLYKNNSNVNNTYKNVLGGLNYKIIFSSEKFYNFDETNGIDKIFALMSYPVFREELIADINSKSPFLYMTAHNNRWGQYFFWSNGKLICKNGAIIDKEYIYIHFQKRKMAELYDLKDLNKLQLIINQFGFFGVSDGQKSQGYKIYSYFPNVAHLFRFFVPRIIKVFKSSALK